VLPSIGEKELRLNVYKFGELLVPQPESQNIKLPNSQEPWLEVSAIKFSKLLNFAVIGFWSGKAILYNLKD
jgi:hypothetical protein